MNMIQLKQWHHFTVTLSSQRHHWTSHTVTSCMFPLHRLCHPSLHFTRSVAQEATLISSTCFSFVIRPSLFLLNSVVLLVCDHLKASWTFSGCSIFVHIFACREIVNNSKDFKLIIRFICLHNTSHDTMNEWMFYFRVDSFTRRIPRGTFQHVNIISLHHTTLSKHKHKQHPTIDILYIVPI